MDPEKKRSSQMKGGAARVDEFERFCHSDRLSLHGVEERVGHLSWEDIRDSSFLHRICQNRTASLGVVEFLLEKYPEAASIPAGWDCCGRFFDDYYQPEEGFQKAFPIHAACSNEYCPDSVIKLLAAKDPSVLSHSCDLGSETDVDVVVYGFLVGGLPLHLYLLRKSSSFINLDTVKFLVEQCPDSLTTARHSDGQIPLHTFLRRQNISALHNIIQYLLEASPSCVRIADNDRNLPIHAACFNVDTSFETFELLLNMWPGSAQQENEQGRLPIHCYCYSYDDGRMVSLPTLNMILGAFPAAVRQVDHDGILPIYWLVTSGHFELFECLCEEFPEATRIQMDGELLIHTACSLGTLDMVDYLLQIYPESIHIRDDKGHLPIHIAATSDDVEVVRLLLSRCLDCAMETTTECGRLPLHIACVYISDHSVDMVKALTDAHPDAITKQDGDGKSPLDIAKDRLNDVEDLLNDDEDSSNDAVHYEGLIEFLKIILAHARRAADAEAMATSDLNGQLPLHVALHGTLSLGAVKLLVRGNPDALEVPDHQGSFPLHIACRGGNCDVVKYLLECNALPVSKLNGEMKLPIHLLLGSEKVNLNSLEYVDTIWCLLCAHPETISG